MLRPSVTAEGDRLVLRNMFDTVSIPLAAIEKVVVRQFLAVAVGGRRYTNSAVGRSMRDIRRDDKRTVDAPDLSPGGLVESRIRRLAENQRASQGIAEFSDEQVALAEDVRRDWAWPEIGLLAAFGLALVVTILL
jgi:hypothetical protein